MLQISFIRIKSYKRTFFITKLFVHEPTNYNKHQTLFEAWNDRNAFYKA